MKFESLIFNILKNFNKKLLNSLKIFLSLNLIVWQSFLIVTSYYQIYTPSKFTNTEITNCDNKNINSNAILKTNYSNNSENLVLKYYSDKFFQKSNHNFTSLKRFEIFYSVNCFLTSNQYNQSYFLLRSPPYSV